MLVASAAQAGTVHVGVDVSQSWLSYATVFELPTVPGADRGAFVYGQFYEPGFYAVPPDTVSGNEVHLRPNTTLDTAETDTANPFFSFWWRPDGAGGYAPNKIVQDGFYIQNDSLAGNDIVFTGFAVANTLVAPYGASARAYIVDTFGPGYEFNAVQYTPLIPGQAFSVNLQVPAGHHVGYGIEVVGPASIPPLRSSSSGPKSLVGKSGSLGGWVSTCLACRSVLNPHARARAARGRIVWRSPRAWAESSGAG